MKDKFQEDMNNLKGRKEQLEESLRRLKVEIEEKKEQKRQIEDALTNIDGKIQYINILRNRQKDEETAEEVIEDGKARQGASK